MSYPLPDVITFVVYVVVWQSLSFKIKKNKKIKKIKKKIKIKKIKKKGIETKFRGADWPELNLIAFLVQCTFRMEW